MIAKEQTSKYFLYASWILSLLVAALAILAWGQDLHWRFAHFSSYQLFPLLGLVGFSLMWSHYMVAAGRMYLDVDALITKRYFELTSWVVLVAILLHPGLLIWQLWRDGFGLPPGSYLENYVAPTLKWAALLGSTSLLLFLAFELHRWYQDRPWWKFVRYGSDFAMLMIFVHGLKLGVTLQHGWFHKLWLFYGISLILALIYMRGNRFFRKAPVAK